ncbi:hypothetical protein F511_29358 [Dorcoceras hygrometricum]|uniref:Uncharacterized protein n=1 Tax=Dorcoceras hygrometricum TaxID=472368 RepID=A0A2Z7DA02_9LAMI|nr:hypothetical protein F511_29358 [Dorcoceras hygrometricum]
MEVLFILCLVVLLQHEFVVSGQGGVNHNELISPSQLEKFVDELQDMPRINGFDVVDGSPVSRSLHIGMFHKKWVSNWFINARVRLWKPMVEEMYLEELKEQDGVGAIQVANVDEDESLQDQNLCTNEDQKPTHDQLIRVDSECLSSIINNPEKNNGKKNKTLQNELQNQSSLEPLRFNLGKKEW